jgi:hypothetical protein
MNRGRSAAAMRALRKKYKLGEFKVASKTMTTNGGWHYKKVHGNRRRKTASKTKKKSANPWANPMKRWVFSMNMPLRGAHGI